MFTLISYDIVVDKQRTKVMKFLKGYGTRVQYSVFECELDARQYATVRSTITDLIDPLTDSVRFYQLDPVNLRRTLIVGIGRVTTKPLYYLIDQPTS